MKSLKAIGLLGFLTLVIGTANAGLIRSAVSATASSELSGFEITNTINQSGLLTGYTSGVDDFDTYLAGNPLHAFGASLEWFTPVGVNSAVVTYDLGSVFSLDKIALWNEDGAGIDSFDILVSLDGINFSEIASNLTPTNHDTVNYPADVFSFGAQNAQYVRLNLDACPQTPNLGYDGCSMGEIAFSTNAVPDPSILTLMGLGLAGLGFARRKREAQAL